MPVKWTGNEAHNIKQLWIYGCMALTNAHSHILFLLFK